MAQAHTRDAAWNPESSCRVKPCTSWGCAVLLACVVVLADDVSRDAVPHAVMQRPPGAAGHTHLVSCELV